VEQRVSRYLEADRTRFELATFLVTSEHWRRHGAAANGGSCPPPNGLQSSSPGPEIIANLLRNVFRERGDVGARTICMKIFTKKLHPDKLKMQQKAFGGRASPLEEHKRPPPRLPGCNEGTYL